MKSEVPNLRRSIKKSDYLVLFMLNVAGMILELVASRLMSPFFSNSNFVWTAIIGIILLAGSLGNIIGGFWIIPALGTKMIFTVLAVYRDC